MRELTIQEVKQVNGGFFNTVVSWCQNTWNDLTTFEVGGRTWQVEPSIDVDWGNRRIEGGEVIFATRF